MSCPKYTSFNNPWCYLIEGQLHTGSHVQVASADAESIESTTYFDESGNEIDPASVVQADCPNCASSNPVYVCGGNITAEVDGIAGNPTCLKGKTVDAIPFHGFSLAMVTESGISIRIWDQDGTELNIDDYEISTDCEQSHILQSAGDQDVFGDGENGSLSAIPEDANSALIHVWDAPVIYTVNGDTPATHIGHRVNDGGWIRLESRQEIDSFQFTNLYAGKIPTLYVHYRT